MLGGRGSSQLLTKENILRGLEAIGKWPLHQEQALGWFSCLHVLLKLSLFIFQELAASLCLMLLFLRLEMMRHFRTSMRLRGGRDHQRF